MKISFPLPVAGRLDTANPSTNRPLGTLAEATDTAHRWLGPRRALTQQTWPFEAGSNYFMNPRIPVFDGTNSQLSATLRSPAQYNLPTDWTLDVVFRPAAVSHSGDLVLSIFRWAVNSITTIDLQILADGSPAQDRRKIRGILTGITTGGVGGTTVTLTGTTQVAIGTSSVNTIHARLQRNAGNAYLWVNGALEASSTYSPATEAHTLNGAVTTTGAVTIGAGTTGGNHLFNGRVLSALLRSGVWSDQTKGLRDYAFTRTPAVHFALVGKGGTTSLTQLREKSLFDTSLTESTMTYEDVTEPAPWVLPGVQGASYFVDVFGTAWNAVAAGGFLYWDQVA